MATEVDCALTVVDPISLVVESNSVSVDLFSINVGSKPAKIGWIFLLFGLTPANVEENRIVVEKNYSYDN